MPSITSKLVIFKAIKRSYFIWVGSTTVISFGKSSEAWWFSIPIVYIDKPYVARP